LKNGALVPTKRATSARNSELNQAHRSLLKYAGPQFQERYRPWLLDGTEANIRELGATFQLQDSAQRLGEMEKSIRTRLLGQQGYHGST
jgi:hypothetical protein